MNKTTKFLIFFSAFMVSATLINFFKINQKDNQLPSQSIAKSQPQRISLKNAKYQRSDKVKNQSKVITSTFPKECETDLEMVGQITHDQYSEILDSEKNFDSYFTHDCQNELAKNKTYRLLSEQAKCDFLSKDFSFEDKDSHGPCSSLFFTLKAYFIADISQDLQISEMTSQELSAHFVKMFFSFDKLTKENYEENVQYANALYERHPQDIEVVEAYLGYMMIAEQITGNKMAQEQINQVLEEKSGISFKIDRLNVLKLIPSKNFEAMKNAIDDLKKIYPSEPELDYYYASYFWKNGERSQTINYLDQALAKGKNCSFCIPELYAETKQKILKAKIGDEKLFSIGVGLNFENL